MVRLIPACAGKTSSGGCCFWVCWAHPRVCGENHSEHGFKTETVGSSPRVRGKHLVVEAVDIDDRLIPACAGKTHLLSGEKLNTTAHPRVCGENILLTRDAARCVGSSPRVRGKHH